MNQDFTSNYHQGIVTSALAFEKNLSHFKKVRAKVKALVEYTSTPQFKKQSGFYGLTIDEGTAIFERLQPNREWWNTVGPRFGELVRDGEIIRIAAPLRNTRRGNIGYVHVTRDLWIALGRPPIAPLRGRKNNA